MAWLPVLEIDWPPEKAAWALKSGCVKANLDWIEKIPKVDGYGSG
jgi:hypothetical protein